jgi:hemoglobin-like flavoprotein
MDASTKRLLKDTIAPVLAFYKRLFELAPETRRQMGYSVQVDHYANAGSALIWMFQQGLGKRFTPAMEEAWFVTYAFMSGEMERGQFENAI